MGQREQLRAKLEAITIENKHCIDWGSGAKPAFKYVNHTNCYWLCLDKNKDLYGYYESIRLPYLVADIETWYDSEPYADICFCLEVLEHTLNPAKVIGNIHDTMVKGGKLYLSVPFLYPEHGDEDYWRFTKNGLKVLLKDFSEVNIEAFEGDSGYWVEATK